MGGGGGAFGYDDLEPDYSVTELFPVSPRLALDVKLLVFLSSIKIFVTTASTTASTILIDEGGKSYNLAVSESSRKDS